jgi:hypothetical protein
MKERWSLSALCSQGEATHIGREGKKGIIVRVG